MNSKILKKLSGKHVVITGASSGIGAALALEFAKYNTKLTLIARRANLLEDLAKKAKVPCNIVPLDLSDLKKATSCIADIESKFGPIDIFVNNAGMENTGPTLESSIDESLQLLRLNLETPLVLTRLLLPKLIQSKGNLINVSSVAGFVPSPMQSWYSASKAGLGAFSESVRAELKNTGVSILTVYPGPVTTPMSEHAYTALGGKRGVLKLLPEGKPEILAKKIISSMLKGKPRLIYPGSYMSSWWLPALSRKMVDKMAPKLFSAQLKTAP
ncbi:hypothetical protein CH373_02465 [Leptospira perolatii]|uniref:Ketoreductase domain-containing protein n=1 Tax=Leptospira perolatii TaxID=2023191 RepID=A0A2M9ZS71_9LEPT|nr:SDR family NAD(P)-dependent oxidoreductase [Leptospira perolatii]PJZ71382.1 hypothetical protein CH360_02465 [Leptospira perolatii]PJZ74916.1 hypothetical protein CH373_02465 [Leptospira perolatii]